MKIILLLKKLKNTECPALIIAPHTTTERRQMYYSLEVVFNVISFQNATLDNFPSHTDLTWESALTCFFALHQNSFFSLQNCIKNEASSCYTISDMNVDCSTLTAS